MRISDFYKTKKIVFSLEVFPPKKTVGIETIYDTLDGLSGVEPDFISVTYGAGGNVADSKTRSIAETVKRDYAIESMAHLTCVTTTTEDAKTILDDFAAHGIENILALRGDHNPERPECHDFSHASDLAALIAEDGRFDIGGACYPEGHTEADSLDDDIEKLKIKVNCGVNFLISQLFFANKYFFRFTEKCLARGIDTPVSAGIMPVTNKKQIERMVTMCGASIPRKLAHLMSKYSDDPASLADAGIDYASSQIEKLIEGGVRGIHLYTMNNPTIAGRIYSNIKHLL